MFDIKYCDGVEGTDEYLKFCVVQSIIGYLPAVSLMLLGSKMFLDLAKIEAPSRYPLSTVQFSFKFFLIAAGILSSFVSLALNLFFYDSITLQPTLTSLFWSINWIIISIAAREEYIRCSRSSFIFKTHILLFLLCHAANFLMNTPNIKFYDFPNKTQDYFLLTMGLNTILLGLLNVLSSIVKEDRTPMQPIDYLLIEGNHDEIIGKQSVKYDMERRSTKVSVSSFLNDDLIQVPSSTINCHTSQKQRKSVTHESVAHEDQTLSEYLRFRAESRKPVSNSSVIIESSKKETVIEKIKEKTEETINEGLQSVAVTDFQMNEDKRIVYVIKFKLNGRDYKIKRRFSLIRNMFKTLIRKYPDEEFSTFPSKISLRSGENNCKESERRQLLDVVFKHLAKFHSNDKTFLNFLETIPDSSSDSTNSSKDSKEGRSVDNLPALLKLKTKEGVTKEIENHISEEIINQSTTTIVKNNGSLIDTKVQRFSLTDSLIPNYSKLANENIESECGIVDRSNASKRGSVQASHKHFKVLIEGTTDRTSEEKGNKKQIYYDIKIIDCFSGKTISAFSRRYSEFKNLHSLLKNGLRRKSNEIPELPFKGKVGIFVTRSDPKVIEYRKFALKSYLQALLNDQSLQRHSELLKFIEVAEL